MPAVPNHSRGQHQRPVRQRPASDRDGRNLGSRPVDLGPVGHLDSAAGYGPWPRATALLTELVSHTKPSTMEVHR
ncbi:alpha/beta hydrolase [Nocardia sp. NPDC059239]|uniref:alpha/beta hydrolase n=1 Tax=unclassified Nocardia TaxID=2637762 RepID=UPI0036B80468